MSGLISQSTRKPPRTMRAVQLANQRPDTAADIEWRTRHNASLKQASDEVIQKFGHENRHCDEASAWFQARVYELMGGRW